MSVTIKASSEPIDPRYCRHLIEFRLPDRLIDALIRAEVPIDSHNLSSIIQILEKRKDTLHQILPVDSLRCVSYILLSSKASSAQEHGLHMLLVRITHTWNGMRDDTDLQE